MNSLERRLQVALSTSVVILMALLGWLVITMAQQLAEEFALTRLQHDGESLLAALQFDTSGKASLNNEQISAIYRRPLSGHYYQIYFTSDEQISSRSLWDNRLEVTLINPGATRQWHSSGPAEQQLLLWAAGYTKQGQHLTLVVAEDITVLQQNLTQYSIGFAALTLFFLAVLLLLQRRIVRRSLQPLHQLSRELDQLERGEIEKLTDEVPQEIRPLVIEVNRLLELMGQRLQRSRSALGNLAHALKGPLNLLTQLADGPDVAQNSQLRSELLRYTGQLRELIEHELKRARLAGGGGAAQRFDMAEELPALIELLRRIYSNKEITFETEYPQGTIQHYDRNDLLELIGNLLDNACKWSNGRIAMLINEGDSFTVSVEDDGPGIAEDEIVKLMQRGGRLDESQPGHGLGLAIVRDIVELYHGEIFLSHSPKLGGLKVSIRLLPFPPLQNGAAT